MQIKFIYPRDVSKDLSKEDLCQRICDKMCDHLKLPDSVIIEFVWLEKHTHADTYVHYKDGPRIRLSLHLALNDIVIPLAHELIHLEQMTLGKLMINYEGLYIWEKQPYEVDTTQVPYGEYLQLPWELEVHNRLPKLLEQLLL